MRRLVPALLALAVAIGGGVAALDRAFPPDLSRLDAVGTEVLDRNGRTVAMYPAKGGVWRFRATAGEVSPSFRDLLIRTEDRHFATHPGIDPFAMLRAALQLLRTGHVVSGGSTLTMQAARLLDPRPRTVSAKLIQMARAVQLEERFSKDEILGIWLTLAPYGGNLEGIRAGSQAWFGIPPAALDPEQAALLVAIPRRPEALRPDRHPDRARALRDRIVASSEPVPARRLPFPRHAAQAFAAGLPLQHSTLDLPLQEAVEKIAADRLQSLPPRASLALLIANLHDRSVRALYAGAWSDEARDGALDLTRALRSPGSALKPVLYAMAFQEGLAAPGSRIDDLPTHFGGYAPENFDRTHAGSVTAAEALRRSLNLPAVALLARLGPARFSAGLAAAGIRLRLPRGAEPSLPLALGGAGITLRDLAALYAGLATDGSVTGLRLLAGDEPPRRPLVQPAAARLVADVLTRKLPEFGPAGIAWKTGTSWGGRDAWALGFDRDNLAAVWVGRPDGSAFPGATGTDLALPLLARLFGLLPAAPRSPAPEAPPPTPAIETGDRLRLLFPPPGAVLSADGPVPLRAMGGRRPLTFLVDGARVAADDPARRLALWSPEGPGFYTVSVLDADGHAARAGVRINASPAGSPPSPSAR